MSLVYGPSSESIQKPKWARHESGCTIWNGAGVCNCIKSDVNPVKPEPVYAVSHNPHCATTRGAPYCDCKPIPVGVKADQGKPRLGLVLVEVPHAFEKLGTLLGFGADKYAVGNWDKVPEGEMRYLDALMRHLTQHHKGEKVDPESGELHLAHAAVNLMFLLDKELRK